MLGSSEVNAPCPKCKKDVTITLEKLANEETVICESCGEHLHLKDEGGKAKEIVDVSKNLEKTLKNLGK